MKLLYPSQVATVFGDGIVPITDVDIHQPVSIDKDARRDFVCRYQHDHDTYELEINEALSSGLVEEEAIRYSLNY